MTVSLCSSRWSRRGLRWNKDGKKYRVGKVYLFLENKDRSYRYTWMIAEMAGEKAECESYVEEMDETGQSWRNTTSCIDHENLRCTRRECKLNETYIDENRKMFESRLSAGGTEKLPGREKNLAQKLSSGPATRSCERGALKDLVSWRANKKTEQLYKVSEPCLDEHHFKKEELESVGELSKVCS